MSSPPSRAYFACGCEGERGNASHVHCEPPGARGRGGTNDSSGSSSTPTRRHNRPVAVVIPMPFPATAYLDRSLSQNPIIVQPEQVTPTIESDNTARPLPAPDLPLRVSDVDSDESSVSDSRPSRGHTTRRRAGRRGNLRSRSSRNASASLNRGELTRGSSRGGASCRRPSRGTSSLRSRNNSSPRRGQTRGEEASTRDTVTGMLTRAAAARESGRGTAPRSSLSMPSGSTRSATSTRAIRNRPIFGRKNTRGYSSRDGAVRYESNMNPTLSTFTNAASYEAGADLSCMASGVSSLTLKTSFTPFSEALKYRFVPEPISEDDPIDIENLDLSDDSECLSFLTEFIEIIAKIKFSYLYPLCKVKARVYTESLKAVIDENQDEKDRAQAIYILLSATIEIINIDDTDVCYINFPIILKKIKMGEDYNGTVKDDTKYEGTLIEAEDFNEEKKIGEREADSEKPDIVTNTEEGDSQKEKQDKPNNIEPDKASSP